MQRVFATRKNNRYDTIYLWSPTLRRQLNNVIVIHLENKKMSQTKSLFCHILIVNLNVSKLWWQKEHIHINNMNLTSVLFMKTFTFTLGELLLTTLKMLTRQRRIVMSRPIRPATTWRSGDFFGQNMPKVAYLRWNNEGCPWDNNEEAWRQIVNNEVLGGMARNFYIEACQREIPELTIIVQK